MTRKQANDRLVIRVRADELKQVKHAASLAHMSMAKYVKRAINMALIRQGVDATLLRERSNR